MIRRSVLLVVLLFVLNVPIAPAQTDVVVGGRAGVTSAQFHGFEKRPSLRGELEEQVHYGVEAGLFASVDLGGPFAVLPELSYVQKGHRVELKDNSTALDSPVSYDANYLQAHLLAQVDVLSLGPITSVVFAGPGVGLCVKEEATYERNGQTITYGYGLLAPAEFSGVLGSGLQFDVPTGTLRFDARYGLSLTSVHDSGGSLRNGVLTVSFGAAVPL